VKAIVSLPAFVSVVLLDVVSKAVAVAVLPPAGGPRPLLGDAVRLTLVYNPGAAFGLSLGAHSRWIFMALSVVALGILARLYRQTRADDLVRALAITLVASGALGNLIDRIRSGLGVVDFIDVGIGPHRWPTFNVADMAVSGGALLLAWVLWADERRAHAAAADAAPRP
jgi:signal peptidase II